MCAQLHFLTYLDLTSFRLNAAILRDFSPAFYVTVRGMGRAVRVLSMCFSRPNPCIVSPGPWVDRVLGANSARRTGVLDEYIEVQSAGTRWK